MRKFFLLSSIVSSIVLICPDQVIAQSASRQKISVRARPLKLALQDIARRFHVELLFSDDVIKLRRAPALSGTFTAEEALAAVLVGSGLALQGAADSGFIVTEAPPGGQSARAAVPDILVVGHVTQNADIQRLANDVQPYQVITRSDVRSQHAATVDELLRKRMSQNAVGLSQAQQPLSGGGSARSAFDLRGLGTDETLVLIDGRPMPRMPGMAAQVFTFTQSDVNGLSVDAIDRAEIITSTAGGIYGPGAIAGVVNLVLRRDYRGAEFSVTRGVTARDDAPYQRIDARVGFTPDGGATDVMLAYSRSVSTGLRNGQRDYVQQARSLQVANTAIRSYTDLPISRSVNIISSNGTPLVLKPAYGGASLGSTLTSLAPGDGRSASALGAALLARAGGVDTTLPDGSGGTGNSLLADRRTSMVLANVRHSFGGGVQAYVDYIRLLDEGRVDVNPVANYMQLSAGDPRNPFQQAIGLTTPLTTVASHGGTQSLTQRLSAGLIVSLPAHWKANLDYSRGFARQTLSFSGSTYGIDGLYALYGITGPGQTALNPFASPSDFNAAMTSYAVPSSSRSVAENHMTDMTARFAGPVAALAGGPLSATVLLEQRREHVGASSYDQLLSYVYGLPYTVPLPDYTEQVRSASIELRAPLVGKDAAFAPLRGLEIQVAARGDDTHVALQPGYLLATTGATDSFDTASHMAMTYTAGAKVTPLPGLLLRASIATGERTPPLSELANARIVGDTGPDPKRGNGLITAPYDLAMYAHGKITPERAQSISAGFVLTPFRPDGATLSVDYTHIRRSHEVNGQYIGTVFYFLQNERLYPDRVTRLPLTAADAARGYTGGVITSIDTSYLNVGWTSIDAVDARVSVPIRTENAGAFTLRANATWQPHYSRFIVANLPVENLVNASDGVLKWRGNGGLDWVKGRFGATLNAQYFGSYQVTYAGGGGVVNNGLVRDQGRLNIPAQLTFDLALAWHLTVPGGGARPRTMDIRLGVEDLFDSNPAIVAAAEGGYSYYGDPRRRRFELTMSFAI
jgi:outer membrane receptor protein involved in Fe transport